MSLTVVNPSIERAGKAAPADERAGTEKERSVVHTLANGITDQGYDVLNPGWENAHCMKITNARGTFCEVTVSKTGAVTWECRPFIGGEADPAQLMNMVLAVLGGGSGDDDHAVPRRHADLTLKGAVGRALRERGLRVRLAMTAPDEDACELYAEIEIVNPARPGQGAVRVDDHGVIRWYCQLGRPDQEVGGIGPAEIGETIGRALNQGDKSLTSAWQPHGSFTAS